MPTADRVMTTPSEARKSTQFYHPSAGTSKPSTQVHFKIDHLVAHRPKLSSNHSRLDMGPRLALLRPAYGSAPIAVPRRVRGAAVEGFRAAASLDSSVPYPYHVVSGRPWSRRLRGRGGCTFPRVDAGFMKSIAFTANLN